MKTPQAQNLPSLPKIYNMKKIMLAGIFITGAMLLTAGSVQAQEEPKDTTTIGQDLKSAAQKTGKVIKEGAQKVGNKTAEVASKSRAAVVDKLYADKVAPNGEKVYIDKHANYYWIDKKGKKHYVDEKELIDKVE